MPAGAPWLLELCLLAPTRDVLGIIRVQILRIQVMASFSRKLLQMLRTVKSDGVGRVAGFGGIPLCRRNWSMGLRDSCRMFLIADR